MKQTFPKDEKLKSRKAIKQLFKEGKAVSKYPIKLLYLPVQHDKTQAGFAVPKRNFKSAVTRNEIKRLMREAYRLHKTETINHNGTTFVLLFLFIGKDVVSYKTAEKAVTTILKKLPITTP
ncbi:MAG: ribonuclease P protein component [Patiriisocius sp.]|jgi:ribonuclease P protein component